MKNKQRQYALKNDIPYKHSYIKAGTALTKGEWKTYFEFPKTDWEVNKIFKKVFVKKGFFYCK